MSENGALRLHYLLCPEHVGWSWEEIEVARKLEGEWMKKQIQYEIAKGEAAVRIFGKGIDDTKE